VYLNHVHNHAKVSSELVSHLMVYNVI